MNFNRNTNYIWLLGNGSKYMPTEKLMASVMYIMLFTLSILCDIKVLIFYGIS